MFVKLIQADIYDPPIIINVDHIVSVRRVGASTMVLLTYGPPIFVRDDFDSLDNFLVDYNEEGVSNNTDDELLQTLKRINETLSEAFITWKKAHQLS